MRSSVQQTEGGFAVLLNSMQAEQLLKDHVAKMASLTDDEFAYFFSHFKPGSFKKGQAVIREGVTREQKQRLIKGDHGR